jgi:hypothetical protein
LPVGIPSSAGDQELSGIGQEITLHVSSSVAVAPCLKRLFIALIPGHQHHKGSTLMHEPCQRSCRRCRNMFELGHSHKS